MIRKLKSSLLGLVLVASCVSVASAAPAPAPVPSAPAQAIETPECAAAVKKALPAYNETKGANVSFDVPGCGKLIRGTDTTAVESDDAIIGIAKLTPNSRWCLGVGGSTSRVNLVGVTVWRVTSRMRYCYENRTNAIYSFQTPPAVSFFTTLGWGAAIAGREASWDDQPYSVQGYTTSIMTLSAVGVIINQFTVGHEFHEYGDGTYTFDDYIG